MKEITLNQLRMLINDSIKDLREKRSELSSNSLKIIHKCSGDTEEMSLPYDFDENLKIFEGLTEKIINYKSKLQQANLTTNVNDTDTISTALIKLEQKRNLLASLDALSVKEEKKSRKIDSSYGNSFYIEHISLNFNKEELLKKRELLREEINLLEAQVNDSNSTT